ncbi:MAG TPA: NAD-dependent epimerase/dehydratase family protein [Chloroflexota bacterium]
MRVIVIGGTRFIGRATVEELVAHGHQVLVVHRGETEPLDFVSVDHLHIPRASLADAAAALTAFRPDAALDSVALTRHDAETALAALPSNIHKVVLSSIDVYRAYSALLHDTESDPLPLNETSPVRSERYPYRGQRADMDDYDKLDVEELYLHEGGTAIRLPMVYGPHDRQRREEFILRRVRAGRRRIPFGAGTWLRCGGFVGSMATGIRRALEQPAVAAGEVFNLADRQTPTIRLWAEHILQAAEFEAELVRVPDEVLPDDLRYTGTVSQHLLADASKARHVLGWDPGDAQAGLQRSVAWHLANPPSEPDSGFDADDRALALAHELSTRTE